jgi:NADH:ubiquinone oxidoreductase subunit E
MMRHDLIEIFSEEHLKAIDAIVERYRNIPGSLLMALEKAQDTCTYLPLELQRYIAERMNISPSVVYGVVTFYSYFSISPKGRKVIKVCKGTACYVKHSADILERLKMHLGIKEGEVTEDGEYSIEEVRCLGACGLAPVTMIGEQTFGLVNPDRAEKILEKA